MPDLLIRDVPDHVLIAIDANARRLGLSRSEYLRRQLVAEVAAANTVSVDDLTRFSETFADLGNPGVMAKAWD